LYVVLVILTPIALTALWPADGIGGLVIRVLLGWLAGGLLWLGVICFTVWIANLSRRDRPGTKP
jgi:hypothetical protein